MEMERKFKRIAERPFFPSLDYFLEDDEYKLTRLRKQVDNMVYFVGLGSKPIKLKVANLEKAAAVISLSDMSVIDITIDQHELDVFNFDRIFGTLAHELGHFVLKTYGLWFDPPLDIENEIFADLSTFYLGFGKFVLRGFLKGNPIGYLTPKTYILSYVISEYLNGREPDTTALSNSIIAMIDKEKSKCRTKWIKDIRTESDLKAKYKKLSTPVGTTVTIISIIENILKNESASLGQFIKKFNDICLNQAKSVPFACRKAAIAYYAFVNSKVDSFVGGKNLNKFIEILALIEIEKEDKFKNAFLTVKHKCPNCGNIINIPSFNTEEGKRIYHIRCNKCNTQFVIDNDLSQIQSLVQQRISMLNRIVPVCQYDFIIYGTIKSLGDELHSVENKNDYLMSVIAKLREENHTLKMNEKRRKSMNWWHRLWNKRNT